MLLDQLGAEGIKTRDLSSSAAARERYTDAWRGGGKAAEQGWAEAGVARPRENVSSRPQQTSTAATASRFTEGMLVHHDQYGTGRITLVIGSGSARKIKVHFRPAGQRTFLPAKPHLALFK